MTPSSKAKMLISGLRIKGFSLSSQHPTPKKKLEYPKKPIE